MERGKNPLSDGLGLILIGCFHGDKKNDFLYDFSKFFMYKVFWAEWGHWVVSEHSTYYLIIICHPVISNSFIVHVITIFVIMCAINVTMSSIFCSDMSLTICSTHQFVRVQARSSQRELLHQESLWASIRRTPSSRVKTSSWFLGLFHQEQGYMRLWCLHG